MPVLFEPYPKQAEFIEAVFSRKHRTLIYGGAMGGGKSYVCAALLCMLARVYAGSKWIVVRKAMPDIERTILPTFQRIYPYNYFEKVRTRPDIIYQGKNGSQIIFMAEDFKNDPDLNRFKSLECNGFFFEQIEEIQEKTYEMAHIRAGRWKVPSKPPILIMASINPTPLWPKQRFYLPWKSGELEKGVYYLPAKITDNPELANDSEYMEGLAHLDSLTRKRHIDGDWDAFDRGKPWAYGFDANKHTATGLEYDPRYPVILSFDFNVDPIVCLLEQNGARDGKPWIRRFKEFRITNSSTKELCTHIQSYFAGKNPRFIVTGDASGTARNTIGGGVSNYIEIQKYLKLHKAQFKGIKGANPRLADSRVVTNSIFENHPDILIDAENCPYYIADLEQVQAKPDDTIDKSKDHRQSHLLDAGRYLDWHFHRDWWKRR